MKILFIIAAIVVGACTTNTEKGLQTNPELEIRKVLQVQEDAWNEGNIPLFMETYWKSDSMQFVGKTIQQGWDATLNRYKQTYPDREAMGTLSFELWQIVKLSADRYLVTGKYTLVRKNDQPSGPFTLIFNLKAGKWVIVYDHTC